jgi:hypothetical protein
MAAQFLVFLEKWSELFPEYKDDDVQAYLGNFVDGSFTLRGNRMQDNIFLISPMRL